MTIPNAQINVSPPPRAEDREQAVMHMLQSNINFASILRCFGVMTMLAAMSAFLLRDWSMGQDIERFYMLLAQTLLLAGGGFSLSYLLKENKGARAFFGLGIISISVNMATLGALIFSLVQWDGALMHYPSYLTWKAVDTGALTTAVMAGLAVTLPVLGFGYMVLARRSARSLAVAALIANVLLLVPVRESALLGITIGLAIAVPLLVVLGRLRNDATLRTREGWFAVASLFIPAGIMLVRSIWLYRMDAMLELLLSVLAFSVLHMVTRLMERDGAIKELLNWLSLIAAGSVACNIIGVLPRDFRFEMISFSLVVAIFFVLSLVVATRDGKTHYSILGAAAFGVFLVQEVLLFFEHSFIAAALTILMGIMVVGVGNALKSRITGLGYALIASGIVVEGYRMIRWIDFGDWLSLAILGGGTIIVASVVERHGAVLQLKWQQLMKPKA